MQPDERDAFLREPRTAVLATTGSRGQIHAVPVWYLWDGSHFCIITERGSVKHRNVARTGRASLCVDQREGGVRYVTAEGTVTVQETVTFEERLALHRLYRGEEAARRIVDRGGHERMVQLILKPEHWLG